jgi:hypothetical protein
MAKASIEEDRLKELVKNAIVEALKERRELVRDVFEEALDGSPGSEPGDEEGKGVPEISCSVFLAPLPNRPRCRQ